MIGIYDPERAVPNYIKQFILAVRRRASSDTVFAAASKASIQKLVIEISTKLKNKEKRIPVLQAITGLPVTSSKQLTQGYVSILIDEVINVCKTNPAALSFIERLVEEPTGLSAWELFPWDRPISISLPTVPEANLF